MEIDGKQYNAIATAGDVYLGGVDWDQRIVDYLAEQFAAKNRGIDPRQNPAGLQRLLREAEDAKRTLSAREQTTITFEYAGDVVRVPFTRQQFEEMTADLLDRTRFTLTNLLQDAGLTVGQDHAAAPGGRIDPHAHGAANGGRGLGPEAGPVVVGRRIGRPRRGDLRRPAVGHARPAPRPEFRVRNVNSHNLGVLGIEKATGRPRNRVMIPRNTALPATQTKRVSSPTAQTRPRWSVNVVEGGDASGNDADADRQVRHPRSAPGVAGRNRRGGHLPVRPRRPIDRQGPAPRTRARKPPPRSSGPRG